MYYIYIIRNIRCNLILIHKKFIKYYFIGWKTKLSFLANQRHLFYNTMSNISNNIIYNIYFKKLKEWMILMKKNKKYTLYINNKYICEYLIKWRKIFEYQQRVHHSYQKLVHNKLNHYWYVWLEIFKMKIYECF